MAEEPKAAVEQARHGDEPDRTMLERLHDPARVLAPADGVVAIVASDHPNHPQSVPETGIGGSRLRR